MANEEEKGKEKEKEKDIPPEASLSPGRKTRKKKTVDTGNEVDTGNDFGSGTLAMLKAGRPISEALAASVYDLVKITVTFNRTSPENNTEFEPEPPPPQFKPSDTDNPLPENNDPVAPKRSKIEDSPPPMETEPVPPKPKEEEKQVAYLSNSYAITYNNISPEEKEARDIRAAMKTLGLEALPQKLDDLKSHAREKIRDQNESSYGDKNNKRQIGKLRDAQDVLRMLYDDKGNLEPQYQQNAAATPESPQTSALPNSPSPRTSFSATAKGPLDEYGAKTGRQAPEGAKEQPQTPRPEDGLHQPQ